MSKLVLAQRDGFRLIVYASKEQETPQQALDGTLAFDAAMTKAIADGKMVQVMREEDGVNVIGKDQLAQYIAQGFYQVRFDEELGNFVPVLPVAGS